LPISASAFSAFALLIGSRKSIQPV